MKPMSLTAYGQRRGVSAVAVSKAVKTGRLAESVVRDENGAPKIADPDLADREWESNTRPHGAAGVFSSEPPPDLAESNALLIAAKARREEALADMAELDLGERRGELINADKARADVEARYSIVRNKVLGIPAGLAQRLPHLAKEMAKEILPALKAMIRESLNALADRSVDGAPAAPQDDA